MKISELPYSRNSASLFHRIAAEDWAVFLDSGQPMIDSGRYDIIAARPWKTLVTRGAETVITVDGGSHRSRLDPFTLVQQQLGAARRNLVGVPFCGGAIGYFAYDLGRRIEKLPDLAHDDIGTPDLAVGFYDWCVIVDHHQRRSWLFGADQSETTSAEWGGLQGLFNNNVTAVTARPAAGGIVGDIEAEMDKDQYAESFHRIQQYIRDGDCYQVNLAQRFSASLDADPWQV